MEPRYYPNPMSDYIPGNEPIVDVSKKLTPLIRDEIHKIYYKVLNYNNLIRKPCRRKGDVSVYNGFSGHAFFYLYMAEKDPDSAENYLETGLKILSPHSLEVDDRYPGFLCGEVGAIATKHVLSSKNSTSSRPCQKVMSIKHSVFNRSSTMANELLYGRVGYLYALLFLRQRGLLEEDETIKELIDVIVSEGHQKGKDHLMWNWHQKEYLGAAHGVAGIIYMLLQAAEDIRPSHLPILDKTVAYLISLRLPSGNYPSRPGSPNDELVQWCHGAPGFAHTFLAAYQCFGKPEYLKAAEMCGDVVWERGLLTKGYGLCHGVAGNAYTFLALYQVTGNDKHLHRALQFARWCGTFNEKQHHPPDNESSLFEGIYGVLYFLKDIQDPTNATFPCYSLKPFKLN